MLLLFHKPFGVLCQFSGDDNTLRSFIEIKDIYPAGRLDKDSEGLLILTDDGKLQDQLAHPRHGKLKTYWVQVEGTISYKAIDQLNEGILLNDGIAAAKSCRLIDAPAIAPRNPPIRVRQHIPTSWIELSLQEGRNRQVRRMTAAVGFPTLRLIRAAIGPYLLGDLAPGQYRVIDGTQVQSRHARKQHPRYSRHVRRR
jgi:23S rRNA pseudouridine2457 synthase